MNIRIAVVATIAAGLAATVAGPAQAVTAATAQTSATPAVCAAESVAGHPCVWQEKDTTSVTGRAQVTVSDLQPVFVKVELKTQKAWGSPWLTVASTTSLRAGSFQVATPRVVTDLRTIVCATTAPALDLTQQVTTCTNPY
ncbi:hypothetical protein ABT095_30460 [Kitasatospora sp. NPDC002227]|uniref:hypothetical protein n=1 Tax=Kitasatospora sp. NPDC002227 TaxID=3154773 RepID=UPI0033168FCD